MPAYRKLLVLLDLSDDSEQVGIAARDLAAASNAEMVALHVVDFVPSEPMGEPLGASLGTSLGGSLMPSVQIEDELIDRARERMNALAAGLGLRRPTLRVEAGNIKAEILRVAAEEGVDLIVLGSRERHGLAILVNLTEDTLLHAARCDVLAVRIK